MSNWLEAINKVRLQAQRPTAIPTARSVLISGLVAILALAFFGAGLLLVGINLLRHEVNDTSKIQAGPRTTEAVVTALHYHSGKSRTYYVAYRYRAELPGGGTQEFNEERTVGSQLYYSLEVGQAIPIVYAAGEPAISRLQAEYPPAGSDYLMWSCPGLIGLGLLLGGLVTVSHTWRQWQLARELDESGMLTTGRIVARWKMRGKSTRYYVAYAFASGQAAQQTVSGSVYNALVDGGTVTIRYLPRDPSVSRMEFGK